MKRMRTISSMILLVLLLTSISLIDISYDQTISDPSSRVVPVEEPGAYIETEPRTRSNNWYTTTVDGFRSCGQFSSITTDSTDAPHIAYWESENQDLKWAFWNGTQWDHVLVDSQEAVVGGVAITMDTRNDEPHFSYACSDKLKHAMYGGIPVRMQYDPVDSINCMSTSIAIDGNGRSHISYYDSLSSDMKYAKKRIAAGWDKETPYPWDAHGEYNDIILDANEYPHISYYNRTAGCLQHAYKITENEWQRDTVDDNGNVGKWTSISFINGEPAISYYDDDNNDLRYAGKVAGAWQTEPVDGGQGNVGEYTAIDVSSQGRIGISYYDADITALKYAYKDGQNWRNEVVDAIGNVGLYTSLVFDSNDQPHISYYDIGNADLKYATIDSRIPQFGQDNSDRSATTGDTFNFNISVTDDHEVGNVYVYWVHGDEGDNLTLQRTGEYWTGSIRISHDISDLRYNISACDVAGNFAETGITTIPVVDDDVPELRFDSSQDRGTTGDNFTFVIGANDNIAVTGVNITWNHGSKSGRCLLRPGRGESTWTGNVTLDEFSIDNLEYSIKINDAHPNYFTSPSPTSVTVTDDDPPTMESDQTNRDPETGNGFDIEARFRDNIEFREVFLKWGFDGANNEGPTPMSGRANDLFGLTISIPENVQSLHYFFIARDSSDNEKELGHRDMDVIDVINPSANAGDDWTIIKGQDVSFNADQSTDNIDLNNFTWRFFYDNENIELYGVNADFTFELPGTYDVELTVMDSYNNTAVDHVSVVVQEGYFDFRVVFNGNHINDGDSHEAEAGSEVEFHASDSYSTFPDRNIVKFHWFCGDEESGVYEFELEDAVFQHTFNDPGTYPVRLTLTDSEGETASINFDVVVLGQEDNDDPHAAIYIGDTLIQQDHEETITVGDRLNLDGSRSEDNVGVVKWSWQIVQHEGDTEDFEGFNLEYDFGKIGRYTVTLTVRDAVGREHSTSFDVKVEPSDDNEAPSAKFEIDGNPIKDGDQKDIEVGTELTFHAGQSTDDRGIYLYEWTITLNDDTNTYSGEELTHRFDGTGHFTVTLRVVDFAGNEDYMSVSIKVSDKPPGKTIGPVRDTHGNIIEGARVTLKIGSQQYEAFTDEEGYAVFDIPEDEIPPGTRIFASKDQIEIEWEQGENIPDFESREDEGEDMPGWLCAVGIAFLVFIVVLIFVIIRKRKRAKEARERDAGSERVKGPESARAGKGTEKRTVPSEPAVSSPKRPEKEKKDEIKEPEKEKKRGKKPTRSPKTAPKPTVEVEKGKIEEEEEEEEEEKEEKEDEKYDDKAEEDDDELPLPPPPEDLKEHLGTLTLEKVAGHIKNIIPGYIITDKLGAGGFATVYKAINKDGVSVAIKMPKFLDETIDSSVLNKFQAESDIWKKLKHKNIVTFLDSDVRPVPYMVIELMEGGNLGGLLKDHRLSIREAKPLMLGILDGLSYAHRMASVHRDIKPENILFTSDGVPKIADWGIGKFMASESVSQSIGTKGTFLYSAPEQFDKETYGQVDWSTDIFQIGVVFYEMLTGKNPFKADELAAVMGRILTVQPGPPSSVNPDIPPEIDEIVMKCLEKHKEDRWRSTDVLYSKLYDVEKRKQVNLKKYRRSLERALSDGKISDDEEAMLGELREHMSITDGEHEGLVGEIMG